MDHSEQRKWMIGQLLCEEEAYKGYRIPADAREQRDLLRALMNVRPPRAIDSAFLKIQDEYLSAENERAGITDIGTLSPCPSDSRLYLWQGDITTLKVDAIVNAANSGLTGCYRPLHNCIDNCIHSRAGIQLRLKCDEIIRRQGHEEPVGQAKITPAYNLPCGYVLHTVGPTVQGELTPEHERLLASCYTACFDLAAENGLASVAFCCISTGVFMFPNQRAAEIAVATIRNRLRDTGSRMKIVFNVHNNRDLSIYRKLLLTAAGA